MKTSFPVSLIVPVYNERTTIEKLIHSIGNQTCPPQEVIIIDGGSTDDTLDLLKQLTATDHHINIIEAGRSMPGEGRNIGAGSATSDWISFTDAGIRLDKLWLENLVIEKERHPDADIIYGNFNPQVDSFFAKCAAISYVPPKKPGKIRTKFIASSLMKKEVWIKTGGFPEWRAAEDLAFMEKAERLGFKPAFAPDAMVDWQLRPNLGSTFRKFELYSKYNVWAGRQAYWHYGVAKQWALALVAIAAAIIFRWYWILFLPAWMIARAMKRIIMHRREFGIANLFNPAVIFMVILITFVIDLATFSGWLKAIFQKRPAFKTVPGITGNIQ